MCGVAGWLAPPGGDAEALRTAVDRMAATLVHRGPDDRGRWTDAAAGIGLGLRRLSVLDPSPAGHQPMLSADGRYVCVFNGEIYNYRDLRAELVRRGLAFRGASDTEVVTNAAAAFGAEATIPRLWGMFALGIWDRVERTLLLARDRLGKKPLYVTRLPGGGWLFASELKAFHAADLGALEVDTAAAADHLPPYLESGAGDLEPAPLRAASKQRAVLGPGGPRPPSRGSAAVRTGAGTDLRTGRAAPGRGGAPHDRRRAARGLPVGRDRLVGGDRAHAGAESAAGADV